MCCYLTLTKTIFKKGIPGFHPDKRFGGETQLAEQKHTWRCLGGVWGHAPLRHFEVLRALIGYLVAFNKSIDLHLFGGKLSHPPPDKH